LLECLTIARELRGIHVLTGVRREQVVQARHRQTATIDGDALNAFHLVRAFGLRCPVGQVSDNGPSAESAQRGNG
jgi:hypothetical protein